MVRHDVVNNVDLLRNSYVNYNILLKVEQQIRDAVIVTFLRFLQINYR